MKTGSLFLAFLFVGGTFTIAQQTRKMCFDYDAAGNRISRTVITLSSAQRSAFDPEEEKIDRTLLNCKVTVYPNPTEGEVILTITNGQEEGISSIGVYDDSGKLLKTLEARGNVSVSIDLSSYSEGVYLINFSQGDNKSFYKIIKK